MGLKLPFPKKFAKTPIEVYEEFTNTDGEKEEKLLYSGMCIYEDKARQIMNAERQLVQASGTAIIEGSISRKIFSGYVTVNDIKKRIYYTERPLNPDGTVFSTELTLL